MFDHACVLGIGRRKRRGHSEWRCACQGLLRRGRLQHEALSARAQMPCGLLRQRKGNDQEQQRRNDCLPAVRSRPWQLLSAWIVRFCRAKVPRGPLLYRRRRGQAAVRCWVVRANDGGQRLHAMRGRDEGGDRDQLLLRLQKRAQKSRRCGRVSF